MISHSLQKCAKSTPVCNLPLNGSSVAKKIFTVQRKANYSDKTRIRRADIKKIALRDGKCSDSAEMKKRLKLLGIKLDLRLTSAWIAIVRELLSEIAALATALITLTPSIKPRYESSIAEFTQISVGDKVKWLAAPAFVESWGALEVLKICGEMADLELVERLVPLAELALAQA